MPVIALHHILVKSPLLAQDVLQELQQGADFANLASEFSACPSAQKSGFAGYHELDHLPEPLRRALTEQQGNSPYIGPIATAQGYHILKAVDLPRTLIVDTPVA